MPGYLKPIIEKIKTQIQRKKITLESFKKNLIDYKSNFVSFNELKYYNLFENPEFHFYFLEKF